MKNYKCMPRGGSSSTAYEGASGLHLGEHSMMLLTLTSAGSPLTCRLSHQSNQKDPCPRTGLTRHARGHGAGDGPTGSPNDVLLICHTEGRVRGVSAEAMVVRWLWGARVGRSGSSRQTQMAGRTRCDRRYTAARRGGCGCSKCASTTTCPSARRARAGSGLLENAPATT